MHQLIQDHLEEVLQSGNQDQGLAANSRTLPAQHPVWKHLEQCEDCSSLVEAMRDQSALIQEGFGLRFATASSLEPSPGFYARVMDRIEAQRPVSVWSLFFDSMWGRRLATSSLAVALLMGGYVVTTEMFGLGEAPVKESAEVYPALPNADFAREVFAIPSSASVPTGDEVFVSLVTYSGR